MIVDAEMLGLSIHRRYLSIVALLLGAWGLVLSQIAVAQQAGVSSLPEIPSHLLESRFASPRFVLREIQIRGNSVFSHEELISVVQEFIGAEVDMGELEEIRLRLSRYYASNGYINSGARLPDQKIRNGVVEIEIEFLVRVYKLPDVHMYVALYSSLKHQLAS